MTTPADPTTPGPNAALAYAVLDHIDADERRLRQGHWLIRAAALDDPPPCGTAGCFFGWTCILAGDTPDFRDDDVSGRVTLPDGTVSFVVDRAEDLLNIDLDASARLSFSYNTREDLGRLVAHIFGPRPDADTGGAR